MNQKISVLFATSLLALSSTSSHAMDLIQVINLAAEQDAQLMIARSQLESTRFSLPQAQSANKPQVNLTANATYQDQNSSLPAGDNEQTSAGFTLSLLQSLYNSETTAQVDTVEANIVKSEAEYKAAQQDLIVRTTEAYFNILAAQDSVDFAQAEKNAIGRQLEQAKKRFEVGLIAITDVKEAQASFDLSLSQEILANNALDNARQALQVVIGQTLTEPLMQLGDQVKLVIPEPANATSWVEQSHKFNLNIMASRASLRAASESRGIAKSNRKPTVNLTASYSNNYIDSDSQGDYDNNGLTLGIQLDMPLYTGGRTGAAISQAEADYASAQNNLLLQTRLTSQLTSNAYLAVVSGIGQVNALKQALISTTAALEATEAGFDVGTRTSVDVLNSLRETYRSKRDYASARYNYLINTLKLKQSAGLLSEKDIPVINQWLTN